MDKDIFVKIFAKADKADKAIVNTDMCLTNYYLEKGFNPFKSAELSESNILNFVEYANNDTFESRNNNLPYLFKSASKDIVEINVDYYAITTIFEKLQKLEWRDFEFLSATILEHCFGALEVQTSQATADGGVDFEGKLPIKSNFDNKTYGMIEVYGQSKRYGNNVGIYDIKSFVAFANKKKRNYVHPPQLFMFFTTSDFAPNALNEIKENSFIGLSGMQLANLIYNHKSILMDKSPILFNFL